MTLLSLPGRSFLNMIYYFLTRDMDEESLDAFLNSLDKIEYDLEQRRKALQRKPEPEPEPTPEPEPNAEDSEAPPDKPATAWNKWVMPEGWTPQGWDPEGSMRAATEFMGFNTNPK